MAKGFIWNGSDHQAQLNLYKDAGGTYTFFDYNSGAPIAKADKIQADTITDEAGTGAPEFTQGLKSSSLKYADIAKPSDFWSSSPVLFTDLGFVGSGGSNGFGIFSNFYRDNTPGVTFLGVGGVTDKGSSVQCLPTGDIEFRGGVVDTTTVTLVALWDESAQDFIFYQGVDIRGYTKLGDTSPGIKVKKLTGVMASTDSTGVNIAHGLTASKIIGFSVGVDYNSDGSYVQPFSSESGVNYLARITSTNLYLATTTNSANVKSKNARAIIIYEE